MGAVEIAEAVNAGQSSAVVVARETMARIDSYADLQPQIWITRLAESTILEHAAAVDQRVAYGEKLSLAGVPFAIKDNIDLAGIPTTAGCTQFAYVPDQSAHVVARLMAAGAVPVGKTNLDQFATGLNGSRSPYGIPACVFNRAYISGGSSSGSAVAVAAGLVPIALGTDTAGSGRVPASFNNLVGFKPTKGRWSTSGLVPACRSLDCISLLSANIADAVLVDQIVAGLDLKDDYSRALEDRALGKRLGIARSEQLNWFGDKESAALYEAAVNDAERAGFYVVPIDIDYLQKAAALLYQGPWVAERTAALTPFLERQADAVHPVVREIVEGGMEISAIEAFRGQYELQRYARLAEQMWADIDLLMLPTCPTIYRIREMLAAPIALNSVLGAYTNFANLLDMTAVAVPAGFRANRTGCGVMLIGPAASDRALLGAADRLCAIMPNREIPPLDQETIVETVQLAVVGAHLRDMPLHWQLTSRDARFVRAAKTASTYRLYAMADSMPPKPALVHVEDGAAIDVEIYELDMTSFGSFVAQVPAPLAIGTLVLEDGSDVKGFVAEPRAILGAEDITSHGGWRAFISER